jgi:hypothetical protein
MDEHGLLAERFETHRARLRAVAYQTLGSASEADDAVQETWLRLSRTDPGNIENLGGWLTARVPLHANRSGHPAGTDQRSRRRRHGRGREADHTRRVHDHRCEDRCDRPYRRPPPHR